jgi:hypothetical protein
MRSTGTETSPEAMREAEMSTGMTQEIGGIVVGRKVGSIAIVEQGRTMIGTEGLVEVGPLVEIIGIGTHLVATAMRMIGCAIKRATLMKARAVESTLRILAKARSKASRNIVLIRKDTIER